MNKVFIVRPSKGSTFIVSFEKLVCVYFIRIQFLPAYVRDFSLREGCSNITEVTILYIRLFS